jgi:hypothetical protein
MGETGIQNFTGRQTQTDKAGLQNKEQLLALKNEKYNSKAILEVKTIIRFVF